VAREVVVADQASGTEAIANQGGAQAAQPATTTAAQAPSVTDLQAELARAQAEAKKLRDEAASHRVRANEQRSAAEKALEEQGQFKALAEERARRLAELESLEGPAKRWAEHEKRETERLAKAREALSPEWQAALDAAPSLEGKQAILAALDKAKPAAPQRAPVGGGPPAGPAAADEDWFSLADSPNDLRAAIARNPTGWQRFQQEQLAGPSKQPTTFQLVNGGRTKSG
jgi:hypothetical protein